jgi:hypothetical protein
MVGVAQVLAVLWIAACGGCTTTGGGDGGKQAGAVQPGGPPASTPVSERPEDADLYTADGVLTALEKAGDRLRSLTAQVKYDRTFPLQGDRQVRVGTLYFVNGSPPAKPGGPREGRKFAIRFSELWLGKERRADEKSYIFDGEWLVEKIPGEKLMIKRQVVPPGEQFDPLRVGEGPLPIPIGQPRQDILKRFEVELLPPEAGLSPPADADPDEANLLEDMRAMATGCVQLRLKPRGNPDDADFREIRLWYRPGPGGILLPRMARTINASAEVSSVLLAAVEVQAVQGPENPKATIPEGIFSTASPSELGWDVQVHEYRKHADPAPGREPAEAGDR